MNAEGMSELAIANELHEKGLKVSAITVTRFLENAKNILATQNERDRQNLEMVRSASVCVNNAMSILEENISALNTEQDRNNLNKFLLTYAKYIELLARMQGTITDAPDVSITIAKQINNALNQPISEELIIIEKQRVEEDIKRQVEYAEERMKKILVERNEKQNY